MIPWSAVTLGDVADLLVGYAYKSSDFTSDPNDARLLRGVNIGQGFLDWGRTAFWPSEGVAGSRYQLADGDVVLAMDRPWIEAGLKRARLRADDLPALLVQRVARVRGTGAVRTSFLHHLLATEAFSRYLQGIVTGATVPHISQGQIEAFRFQLPPIFAQDSICEVLDSIEDMIENNRRRVQVLEEMARAIYREWFVRFRYPGHVDIPLIDSPLGPIPDGWDVASLADVAAPITRGIAPQYADDGPSTVINQKCIRDGRISLEKARRQERAVPEAKQVRKGDVLVNSTGVGTLGRAALCLLDHPSLTVDTHVTIVRPALESSNPWFGLDMVSRQVEFEQLATGSTGQTELSRSDIGAMNAAIPPEPIRIAFANATWPQLEAALALLDQNRSLGALRDLLLPKLVTGQIDVSHLDLCSLTEASIA